MSRNIRQPKDVWCPACNATPQQPCTQPTDTSRREVAWFHNARTDRAEIGAYDERDGEAPELKFAQVLELFGRYIKAGDKSQQKAYDALVELIKGTDYEGSYYDPRGETIVPREQS